MRILIIVAAVTVAPFSLAFGQTEPPAKDSPGRGQYREFVPCKGDCLERAKALYKEINDYNARLQSKTVCESAYTVDQQNRYREERHRLSEKWRKLNAQCTKEQGCSIRLPPPLSRPTLSNKGPCKTDAVLAELKDKRDELEKELNALEAKAEHYDYICNAFSVYSPSVEVSAGAGIEVGGGVQVDFGAYCKVWATIRPGYIRAKKDALVDARRAVEDPPSDDFLRVVEPRIERVPVPAGVSSSVTGGYNAVNAQRAASAYLSAYVDALERFQGAEAADNGTAMRRQARAMARFAGSARTASRNAAQSWQAFERPWISALDRWSRAQGLTGKDGGRATVAERRAKALDALEKARRDGRISETVAMGAQRGIDFLFGERWPMVLADWRDGLKRSSPPAEAQFAAVLLDLARGIEEHIALRLELPKEATTRE